MRKNTLWKKVRTAVSATIMSLAVILAPLSGGGMTAEAAVVKSDFLKANGKVLRNNYGNGDTVYLRGTNAGGYLVQEFWMTPTDYSYNGYTVTCEKDIYETLTTRFGEQKMRNLIDVYQDNYWTEADFDNCKNLGINCIRLPFWYMNFVDFNGNYIDGCFDRMDWFIQEAGERGIYVILDFHGAPGSQNGSDHSGIDGGDNKEGASEFFFGNNAYNNQQLYYDIWYKIAQRYAGNPTVAAYDLLNEPYCTYRYNSTHSEEELHNTLWSIYDIAYDVIRSADPDHVIIMEATWDAWDLPNPSDYGWSNVMYEYHNYLYDDYDNLNGQQIASMQNKINGINAMNYNVPSYMGEFSYFNNVSAWQQGLQLLNNAGLNWTSWTYKVTGTNNNWGLYNQEVSRANVATDSYDTIYDKWSKVGNSTPNKTLLDAIKGYFPGTVASDGQSNSNNNAVSLSNGEYYLVGAHSGKVVCGDNYGNDPLVANRDSYGGAWETFSVVNNNDGTISLKCGSNGKYVCAVMDEEKQLLARSSAIEDWEKFYLVRVSDTEYALQAKTNGKYVCVDENNGNVLYADRDSVSGWETFRIYNTNGTQMKSSSVADNTTVINTNAKYRIVSRKSGKCLDIEGGKTSAGANVLQWDNNGGTNQMWYIVSNSDGSYTLKSVLSNKVLDVEDNSTKNGGNVIVWNSNNQDNQKWWITSLGNGYYSIISKRSGKSIDVEENSTKNGGNVIQWDYHGGENQQWELEVVY